MLKLVEFLGARRGAVRKKRCRRVAVPNRRSQANWSSILPARRRTGPKTILTTWLTLFALSNLWMARKKLMVMAGVVRPQTA